eukprot:jgi/Galph1/2411/GphlegSOOS_G1034.1
MPSWWKQTHSFIVTTFKRSFWEKAQEYGSKTAVISRKNYYSYEQLARDSKQRALWLSGAKDLEQARVALLVPPSYAYVSWQWAIWQSGGVCVPLSPSYPQEELEYFVRDAEVSHMVVSSEYQDTLSKIAGEYCMPYLRTSSVDGSLLMGTERKKMDVDTITFPKIDKKRNAMIIYTSGTTSRPKGVVYTHEMIEAQIRSLVEAWKWTSQDCILNVLPLHHVHGIINVVCCALYSGATLEMMEKFQAQPVWERLMLNLIPQGNHITLFMAVPTIYQRLIQMYQVAPPGIQPLLSDAAKTLRLFVSGSAALPETVFHQWKAITGQYILERYGMTEIGMALSNPLKEEDRRPGWVGYPLPGVQVRLKKEEEERQQGKCARGELIVKGAGVFREYWNRPEATKAAFDEEGYFQTGDIAQCDETGCYQIVGRASVDIIKSGGYKISALEIERVFQEHPAIQQCSCVGVVDGDLGEAVAMIVVLKDGYKSEDLTIEAFREWGKGKLASYKLPKRLKVVKSIPVNAMGKVQKKQVAKEMFG